LNVKVETFWQTNIGLWVIKVTNESNEQIGILTYATDEKEANIEVKRIKKLYKEAE